MNKKPDDDEKLIYAGVTVTRGQVRHTIALLRYFREFRQSGEGLCQDPTSEWRYNRLSQAQARRKRDFLIHVAINRRAGLPDEPFKRGEADYMWRAWRDQQNLHYILTTRLRVYQFETHEVRRRYGHLLADRSEDY